MTTLCNVHHPDLLIFFYLFICLFIDEEDGNALAVGCTAFNRCVVDTESLFDYQSCQYSILDTTLWLPKGVRFNFGALT